MGGTHFSGPKTLAEKLEYTMLGVLVHYHGEVKTSLNNWYLSVNLAFPEIDDINQITSAFKQLWESGLIALNSPWIGDYDENSGDDELHFLALDEFTVALTARGIVRWDNIRRWPKRTREEVCMRAYIQ